MTLKLFRRLVISMENSLSLEKLTGTEYSYNDREAYLNIERGTLNCLQENLKIIITENEVNLGKLHNEGLKQKEEKEENVRTKIAD